MNNSHKPLEQSVIFNLFIIFGHFIGSIIKGFTNGYKASGDRPIE